MNTKSVFVRQTIDKRFRIQVGNGDDYEAHMIIAVFYAHYSEGDIRAYYRPRKCSPVFELHHTTTRCHWIGVPILPHENLKPIKIIRNNGGPTSMSIRILNTKYERSSRSYHVSYSDFDTFGVFEQHFNSVLSKHLLYEFSNMHSLQITSVLNDTGIYSLQFLIVELINHFVNQLEVITIPDGDIRSVLRVGVHMKPYHRMFMSGHYKYNISVIAPSRQCPECHPVQQLHITAHSQHCLEHCPFHVHATQYSKDHRRYIVHENICRPQCVCANVPSFESLDIHISMPLHSRCYTCKLELLLATPPIKGTKKEVGFKLSDKLQFLR